MLRLIIEVGIAAALMYGVWKYRKKYRAAVLHHREAAVTWQRMMLNIMAEQVGRYFKDSAVTSHIVRLNTNREIEILIGDDDFVVAVDMELFKEDIDAAFEDAYNRFVTHVR